MRYSKKSSVEEKGNNYSTSVVPQFNKRKEPTQPETKQSVAEPVPKKARTEIDKIDERLSVGSVSKFLQSNRIGRRFASKEENLDKKLDAYYTEAYKHLKKHHGITYEQFVARASDSIANNTVSFDRPTNVANLLLEGRLGEGVGSGKPVNIKGKTAESGAAAGMIPVDQSKSKLADRRRGNEIMEYNHKNETQLEGKNPAAVAIHLTYKDGKKWYSTPDRQEYYELKGNFFKSAGDPDNTAKDVKIVGKLGVKGQLIVGDLVADKLMVMGDPVKSGEPYKGDIDHGLNAFSKEYYEYPENYKGPKIKQEIRPEWIAIDGQKILNENNNSFLARIYHFISNKKIQIFGGSTQEQHALAIAEIADPKLNTMIRHSSENFFNLSNHHIIQEDLTQGLPLMMPDGGISIIRADVKTENVFHLDPKTLEWKQFQSKDPQLDAEKILVEKINEMSATHAVYPNPRWGWKAGVDGKFFIPENRIDFKKIDLQEKKLQCAVDNKKNLGSEIEIKDEDNKKSGDQLNEKQRNKLSSYKDKEAQLKALKNINELYSSIIAFQFNQAIFGNKSEYKDEVADVVVNAINYQNAVKKLGELNTQYHEKHKSETSLFSQGGEKLVEDLKGFSVVLNVAKIDTKQNDSLSKDVSDIISALRGGLRATQVENGVEMAVLGKSRQGLQPKEVSR